MKKILNLISLFQTRLLKSKLELQKFPKHIKIIKIYVPAKKLKFISDHRYKIRIKLLDIKTILNIKKSNI